MRIVTIPEVSLSSFPLVWRGKMTLWATLGMAFPLTPPDAGEVGVVPAAEGWAAAAKAVTPGATFDLGVPKVAGEWLMAGRAFTPDGEPRTGLEVRAQVGELERGFLVTGERVAEGELEARMSQPKPFTSSPLSWEEAVVSPEHNPLGKGATPDAATGHLPMATLTELGRGPAMPGDGGLPACPEPLGAWPCRMNNLGTYDAAWLKTRWPGVPDDLDWTFYQLAQSAQRLPKDRFFTHGEAVRVTHVHPKHPVLTGRLPARRLRVFVDRNTDPVSVDNDFAKPQWEEMPLRCDTVWLFPNQQCGLVLWHGACTTRDEASSDVAQVVVVLEDANLPMQPPAEAVAPVFAPPPPPPPPPAPDIPPVSAPTIPPVPPAAAMAAGAAASVVVGGGVTAAAMPQSVDEILAAAAATPPPASALEALGGTSPEKMVADGLAELAANRGAINEELVKLGLSPLNAAQEAEVARQLNELAQGMENMAKQMAKSPATPDEAMLAAGMSKEQVGMVKSIAELVPPDPASFTNQAAYAAEVERYAAQASKIGGFTADQTNFVRGSYLAMGPQPPSFVDSPLASHLGGLDKASLAKLDTLTRGGGPTPLAAMTDAGIEEGLAKRILAAAEGPIPKPEQFATMGAYQKALEAHAAALETSLGFPAGSMTGPMADLHKMGAETGLIPPELSTGFTPPPPSPPVAPPPVAPPPVAAVPEAAVASPPPPPVAAAPPPLPPILTRADVEQALATGRPLAGERLAGLDLSELSFVGADLSRTDCTGTDFSRADLSGVQAVDATFDRAVLTQCRAAGCNVSRAGFYEAKLMESDFSKAVGERADFERADLSRAVFAGARLTDAAFVDSVGRETNFSAAHLAGSRVMGKTDFSGATLSRACLDGASWENLQGAALDCSEVSAQRARFERCGFEGSRWTRASLPKTTFAGSNLREAQFERVNLLGGSLRGTRLGGADLREANLYGADLYLAAVDEKTNLARADVASTCLATVMELTT